MKYIIVSELSPHPTREWAILIPDLVQHYHAVNRAECKPLSAGQCKIGADGRVQTFGESTTLGLHPRPQDAAIIARTLLFAGLAATMEHETALALAIQATTGAASVRELQTTNH
jgi:hypothetical protein